MNINVFGLIGRWRLRITSKGKREVKQARKKSKYYVVNFWAGHSLTYHAQTHMYTELVTQAHGASFCALYLEQSVRDLSTKDFICWSHSISQLSLRYPKIKVQPFQVKNLVCLGRSLSHHLSLEIVGKARTLHGFGLTGLYLLLVLTQ